jgi:predicted nicotinamide N-methyase
LIDTAAFIRANTVLTAPGLVPELQLHLASEITPIWQASEDWLRRQAIEPPFWAFAWPGGIATARYILDNPESVAGRHVLDFAAGSGIAALAAAQAGAATVEAVEIDPLSVAAIGLNAVANGLRVRAVLGDVVGSACRWDLILAGDVCYEAPMTRRILPWMALMARQAEIWIADPGRAYLPAGMTALASYDVPTSLELEDRMVRRTTIFRMAAQP